MQPLRGIVPDAGQAPMPNNPNALMDLPQLIAPMLAMGPVGIIAALGWVMYYRTDRDLKRKERENRALTEKFITLAVSNGQLVQQVNGVRTREGAP